jgi:FKBP-type peptidyl-prolyl cis-trans isomerase FkpA
MRTILPLVLAVALAGCGEKTSTSPGAPLANDEQKTLYALGLIEARRLSQFDLNAADLEIVKRGLTDGVTGKKAEIELEQFGPKVGEMAQKRAGARADKEKAKAAAFLETAGAEAGAQKLPSGLIYKTITPGDGASPTATDVVKVHYHGTLTDGTVFDSSVQRKEPAEFPLNRVIPCWTEGVQKMKLHEKAKLVCPSSIAYGDRGSPPKIPGGAALIFEVELLEIKEKPAAPAAPAMSSPPPTGAPPTATGPKPPKPAK